MRRWWLAGVLSLLVACAGRTTPVVDPSLLSFSPTPSERMLEAAALVRAGCLDCLVAAYQAYTALRTVSDVGGEATAAAVRAAALIALRERELGIVDSGTLIDARALTDLTPALSSAVAPLLEVIETLGARGPAGSGPISSDAQLQAIGTASRNRQSWTTLLQDRADEDELTAYLWVAFNCSYNNPTTDEGAALADAVPAWKDSALIRFRLASCTTLQIPALEALRADDPRFAEIGYYSGLQALILGELEAAELQLAGANDWRPRWPAVTSLRAGAFMTVEDFERAADLYGRTLELVPDHVEAMLGRLRALIFLGRYIEAIDASTRLLALGQWYIGDAHYWRAMAEHHLERYDEAWESIERAAKLLRNADVPKLAGIIAVARRQLPVARQKFEEARERNPSDCETPYFLGAVLVEQQEWRGSVDALAEASDCFDRSQTGLEADIARIRASSQAPERQARQVARREQRLVIEARMRSTARFNAAVALFNQTRYGEARSYAERLADDEQFGERARILLSRLPPGPR
jgi:tetratricopeptide (TPR) repeat protein